MRSNRYLLSLLILTVLIVSIGAISAADNSTVSNISSDIADSGSLDTSSNSGSSIIGGSSNGTSIESDVHVTTDNGSEIQNEINNSNNTVIYLDNQTFVLNSTSGYGLLVNSSKNLTICGGYSIGDGKTSTLSGEILASEIPTLFINRNSTVTLININFINNDARVDWDTYWDYALKNYGKLVLINCTFDNNTQSLLSFNDTVLINCTLIDTSCYLENVDEFVVNNSNFRNSSIYLGNSNSTITNSVFDGGSNSAIHLYNGDKCFIDNCTFSNINSSGYGAAINSVNCIINITNSKFNNNSARGGGACYFNINEYSDTVSNVTLYNCTFDNNSALAGGSIYCSGSFINSTNCSYDGNSALYGGAIYGNSSTILINGSIFKDNYAPISGGAVSSYLGYTVIDNSQFVNNSADVCGGAIVNGGVITTFGNDTFYGSTVSVSNSNFTSNDGQDYGNDVYCYGSNLTLNNNSISSVLNVSNDTLYLPSLYTSDGFVVYLDNNTTGFCLEENFDYPGSSGSYPGDYSGMYIIFNHTNLALNSLNYQKVGDYIKYIIVNYYGKVPDLVLNYAIWTFTDNNYTNPVTEYTIGNIYYIIKQNKYHEPLLGISSNLASTLLGDSYLLNDSQIAEVSAIVNDALSAYNSGVRIPDYYVDVDENGTGTLYDFGSIFSNYYQNFITFKTSTYDVVYDMNVTKITNTPVVIQGNDTSFDIVVANNGTMTLYNVTLTEDSFDDLTFKSWSNVSGNWTYSLVDGKPTWTLNDSLEVNQSAIITVVFSTENATLGDKINTVIVSSNETGNKTANNTTTVGNCSFTVVKGVLTPIVVKGNDTSFSIVVTNDGTLNLTNVTVYEDSFGDLSFKNWTSTADWTFNNDSVNPSWTLNGVLEPGSNVTITVVFSTENATAGDKINTVIVSSNETGNKTTNNTTTVENYSFTVSKEALSSVVYAGDDAVFRIVVTNDGTLTLTNVTVSEVSFDDLIYKSWSAVTGDWVYNNDLTWTINELTPNESASFDVTFDTSSSAAGSKVNTVIVTTNETGNKTANNTTTVMENITNNTNSSLNKTNEINETNDTGYADNEELIVKEGIKTTETTGYPFIALIIALIGIIGTGFRRK